MANISSIIVQIERTRRKLNRVDPADRKRLMYLSRKLDRLVVQYYRAKLPSSKGLAGGARTDR